MVAEDAAVAAWAGRLRVVLRLPELRREQARRQALLLREQPELRAEAVVVEDAVAAVGAVVLPLLQRLFPLRSRCRSWIFALQAE